MKKAIVLSGGGSNGAYQIGVWKALKKKNYNYDIVTGTSVGSINGALMVEQDFKKALYMWERLDFNMIFENTDNLNLTKEEGTKEIIKMYTKGVLFDGGMDVKRLEKTITEVINIKKIYESKIDYGLVTVKLPNLTPVTLTKKEISKLDFKDYIIASSTCFPFFQKKKIKNDFYIDGGYHDNLPINLAIDMGAKEIIAVDLNTFGLKQRIKKDEVNITYISPKNKLGSFLVFDKNTSLINIQYGYNDTMKVFGKLDGDKFTFKKGHLERIFDQIYYKFLNKLEELLNAKSEKNNIMDQILKITSYKYLLNYDLKASKRVYIQTIEYLGSIFKMEDYKIYNINLYNKEIIKRLRMNENIIDESKLTKKAKFNVFDKESIIKFLYEKIENNHSNENLINYALLFKKEFLGALYLYIINNQKVSFFERIFK